MHNLKQQKPVVSPIKEMETDKERYERWNKEKNKQIRTWAIFMLVFGFAIGCYIGLWQGVKAPHGLTEARLLEENKTLQEQNTELSRKYDNCIWNRGEKDMALSKIR